MLKRTIVSVISLYRYLVSPMLPQSCRFYPTCSEYSMKAFETRGISLGAYLTVKRLLKCHPLHPGGFDPPPAR